MINDVVTLQLRQRNVLCIREDAKKRGRVMKRMKRRRGLTEVTQRPLFSLTKKTI